jgi:hypothetical protein
MNQKTPENAQQRRTAEWQFLKYLCVPNLPVAVRQDFCSKLPAALFTDLAYQIVFEEIRALSKPRHPGLTSDLREHLPTRVTARGFPDLDFLDLFASSDIPPEEAHAQLRQAHRLLLSIEQN